MSCRLEAVAAAAANEATNVVARPNLGDVPSIRVQLSSLQARTQPSRGAAAVAVAVVDVGSPRVGRVESLASLRNESLAPLSLMLSTSATVTLLLSLCSWLPPHSVRPTFRLSLFLRLLSSVRLPAAADDEHVSPVSAQQPHVYMWAGQELWRKGVSFSAAPEPASSTHAAANSAAATKNENLLLTCDSRALVGRTHTHTVRL